MKNLLTAVVLLILFSACQKEDQAKPIIDKDTTLFSLVVGDKEGKGEAHKDCFEMIYPITITMPDGTELSGEEEPLWGEVKAWYAMHPDSKEKPAIQYPVLIIWEDTYTKTVESDEEFAIVKKACEGYFYTDVKKDCFVLGYPLSMAMPDGSLVSMANDNDWDAVKAWYEAHPDSKEEVEFVFPINIVFDDGSIQEIDSDTALESAKEDCD